MNTWFRRRGSLVSRSAVVLSLGLAPAAHAEVIPLGDVIVLPAGPLSVLNVGFSGVGSLQISAGSVVDGVFPPPPAAGQPYQPVDVGSQPGADGTVRVTGAGSKLTTSGPATQPGMTVGASGTGKLEVLAGGTVSANRLDAAQFATGAGTVKVDGVGSMINSQSTFNIGTRGATVAEITGGGVVNAQTSNIGSLAGSDGKLTVSGTGSQLNLMTGAAAPAFGRAFLNIGRAQKGQLDILAGGKVTLDAAPVGTGITGMNVGGGLASPGESLANANGTLNIDGVGSELRIKQEFARMNIGRSGNATALVNVTNGGKLIMESTDSPNSFSVIGVEAAAKGAVNVTGPGSEWQAGGRLFIGSGAGGSGVLNVANGGTVQVADSITIRPLGTLTGGGGTLVGNVTNEGKIAPGTSPGVTNVFGNVSLTMLGTVELELGGTALADYDQLNAFDNPATGSVEGLLGLDGLVKVLLFGGFAPAAGSFFDVFTALDINLGAPAFELPTLGSGLDWQMQVIDLTGREALRLSVVAGTVPLPGTFALAGLALLILPFFARSGRAARRPV